MSPTALSGRGTLLPPLMMSYDSVIDMATSDTYTPEDEGALSAKARYTDGHGANKEVIEEAAAVIVNLANVAPKFPDTETGMRAVAENTPAGGAINDDTEADPVEAMDANEVEGAKLTYTLSGTDAASFDIDRGTGQLRTKAKLDYETKNSYMVTVTARDSDGLSASIDVTIMVIDMDEAPMIMLGGLAISGMSSPRFAENGTGSVATYTATGPDADRASWSLEGADVGDFRISSGGMLTFRSSPDYENPMDADMDNMYMVTVKASDGTYMDTHAVMVRVTNEDELGMLLGQDSVGYMENDTVAVGTYTADGPLTPTWSLSGDDADDFSIGSGMLMFRATPDYENPADMDGTATPTW